MAKKTKKRTTKKITRKTTRKSKTKRKSRAKTMQSQVTPGRFIVLLDDYSKSSVKKAQKALNVSLVSSEELNSEVRAKDITDAGHGIHFKNLGVAVIDKVESAKLEMAVQRSTNPIIYWEAEREFRPASELEKIAAMKISIQALMSQAEELEFLLNNRNQPRASSTTWGVSALNLEHSSLTGQGIDVCILDTGFFIGHPDFSGRSIIGKSFIPGEDWDQDGNGHGTHCAGTAVGHISLNQDIRYGVAPEANLVVGKVLSDAGSGSTSGIVDAIDWAIEKQFKVVSMSLGSPVRIGENPSPIFEVVGQRALESNVLLIAAAGNDSRRPGTPKPVSMPANSSSIMAIAAVDSDLHVASFSNGGINSGTGGRVDLAAPGVGVFSSYSENAASGPDQYASLSGTSMATPHVAGLAALYWEQNPNLSAAEMWLKLEKNAKSLHPQAFRDIGNGLAQLV